MVTYGGLLIKDGQSHTMCTVHDGHNKTTQTFKYHQPFGDFYIYCHVVDDNNKYCHNTDTKCGLSLETTWVTHMWANWAFAFIIRICKVNAYLAANDHLDKSFLSFRKKLTKSLINNPYYVHKLREMRRSRSQANEVPSHKHCSALAGVHTALDRQVVGHFKQNKVSSVSLQDTWVQKQGVHLLLL